MQTKEQLLAQVVDHLIDLTGRGGVKQKDIAERLGVAETYLSQLKNRKNGKYPSEKLAKQIALIYKEIFPTAMMGESEEEAGPYSELPPLTRFGGNREGALTDLSAPAPSGYGDTLKAVLGPVLFNRAIEAAANEGFSDFEEYLRYTIRAKLDEHEKASNDPMNYGNDLTHKNCLNLDDLKKEKEYREQQQKEYREQREAFWESMQKRASAEDAERANANSVAPKLREIKMALRLDDTKDSAAVAAETAKAMEDAEQKAKKLAQKRISKQQKNK